jgi:hypothetical protein
MVLSIRKISTENTDLAEQGILWFKNLNEPDAYLILPVMATVLNYFNLGVSVICSNNCLSHCVALNYLAWNYQRKRALVHQSIQVILLSAAISPLAVHTPMASWRFRLLDQQLSLRDHAVDGHA